MKNGGEFERARPRLDFMESGAFVCRWALCDAPGRSYLLVRRTGCVGEEGFDNFKQEPRESL